MVGTASEYLDIVRETPNSAEGANQLVEHGKQTLEAIDWEITRLFEDRRLVRDLAAQFAQLEAILSGSSPLIEQEIEQLVGPPTVIAASYSVRKTVLDVANSAGEPVTVGYIVEELRKRLWGETLPWSNPQAAIGTILYQSGDWHRIDRGVFARVVKADEEISPDDLPF